MEELDIKKRPKLSTAVKEQSEPGLVLKGDQPEVLASQNDVEQGGNPQQQTAVRASDSANVQTFSDLGLPSRYKVVELLGEGGMAHVYKALDTEHSGTLVAIKILRPEIVPDPSIVERFFREAKSSQKLAHQNLVSVFDYGTTEDHMPYLIMEYVDGRNLAQIIAEEGHLSSDRSIEIFLQIANGLKDAHRLGVVHRDLKPSNILIATTDDGTDLVKVTDFGIAKPASSERFINPDLTKTGAILGSPAYMSPEQCLGHVVDERSDIYSLGCLMYETLTGKSPFAADTPVKSLIRHIEDKAEPFEIEFSHLRVPKGLESVVLKCLNKEPANRFQRIQQLSDALLRPSDTGVGRRFLAEAIDIVTLFSISLPIQSLIIDFPLKGMTQATVYFLHCVSAYALLSIVYYTGFESSKLQATPGKLFCGLKVWNEDGTRLTLASNFLAAVTVASLICAISHAAFYCTLKCFAFFNHSLMMFPFALQLYLITSFFVMSPTVSNNGRRNLFDQLFDRQVTLPVTAKAAKGRTPLKHALTGIGVIMFVLAFNHAIDTGAINLPFIQNVVCTKSWVDPGTVITKEMIEVESAPAFFIPEHAITDVDQVIGKQVNKRMPPLAAFKPSLFANQVDSDQKSVKTSDPDSQ